MTAAPPTRIDVEDVRAALRPEQVIREFGLRARLSGGWHRMKQCPRCGETSSSAAIAIRARDGAWLHHGHERNAGGTCSGDLLDLVAACAQLDCRREFDAVVIRGAAIAGVTGSASDRAERARAAEERDRAERAAEAARSERATEIATQRWGELERWHRAGHAYLERRGLDHELLTDADLVRFTPRGDVAVTIWSLGVGRRRTNVAIRMLPPEPDPARKVIVLSGCPTPGSMLFPLAAIERGQDAVLVEGLADALTALQAWPRSSVHGANGAGNLPRLASAVAARCRAFRTRMLVVPQNDAPNKHGVRVGERAAVVAAQAALAAGLELGRDLLIVDLGGAKDLNAAWCAGWRPAARAASMGATCTSP